MYHVRFGHYFNFLGRAIHGLAPGSKMAAPWGPKLISTFRGHMDLHHPVREKNLSYFNIGHFSCQIWPLFQFLLRGSCSMDRDAYAYISEHPANCLNHQSFVWFCGPYVRKLIFGHGKAGINFQIYPISPIEIKCIWWSRNDPDPERVKRSKWLLCLETWLWVKVICCYKQFGHLAPFSTDTAYLWKWWSAMLHNMTFSLGQVRNN